jgi:CheY-like chemotaxis protein
MATVLIVDDDRDLRQIMSGGLVSRGHTVASASDGAEALQLLEQQQVDLVILDLDMPRMDGREFQRLYRERPGPLAPILLCSATATEETAEELGARGYISKPFRLSELLRHIEQCLPPFVER